MGGENISGGPTGRLNHLVTSYFNLHPGFSLHFTQKSQKSLFFYSGGCAPQARRRDNSFKPWPISVKIPNSRLKPIKVLDGVRPELAKQVFFCSLLLT